MRSLMRYRTFFSGFFCTSNISGKTRVLAFLIGVYVIISALLLFKPCFAQIFCYVHQLRRDTTSLGFIRVTILIDTPIVFNKEKGFVLIAFDHTTINMA